MFAALGNCKLFCKLDLRAAFQQLMLDEQSQNLCVVNTHLGLFKPKRLPYGIASSPALWQQVMDRIFHGLQGTFVFIDDILIAGRDENELLERLKEVLKRIKDYGITIKKEKCEFKVSDIEYLGFKIDEKGIHKTDSKIDAIKYLKTPRNVKELQAYLGLVTFYGKFIPNLAMKAHALYQLLKKDVKWVWNEACNKAFQSINKDLMSPTFLTHFRDDLPLKLMCDASPLGVAAILFHEMPDGVERPIAYASRTLSDAEKNYSQIDKEALALIFGVTKFHMYLYGKKTFTLITDHKPLLAILGHNKGLPKLVALRLQRWAVILSAYSYELEYRPSTKITNVDALSRLPTNSTLKVPEDQSVMIITASEIPLTAKIIARETQKDPILSKVYQNIFANIQFDSRNTDLIPYANICNELNINQGCVLRNARVIIPKSLQQQLLTEIHVDHPGMVRTKELLRSYVWWPGLDADIEQNVRSCTGCQQQRNNPPPVRLHPWEHPKYPWQRIHIDYAGPFLNRYYLVVMDSYSKWPEIIPTYSITSSTTKNALIKIFATHGIPEAIVSDNATSFKSDEFQAFLRRHGIYHIVSAPYHPSTNGEIERFIQTFKRNMKSRNFHPNELITNIYSFLFAYRITPHATTGLPPSYLLMGRYLKNKFNLLLPNLSNRIMIRQWDQIAKEKIIPDALKENDPILLRNYLSPDKWKTGTIAKPLGKLHYEVNVDGKTVKRHVDQLLPDKTSEQTDDAAEVIPGPISANSPMKNTPQRTLPHRVTRGVPPDRLTYY